MSGVLSLVPLLQQYQVFLHSIHPVAKSKVQLNSTPSLAHVLEDQEIITGNLLSFPKGGLLVTMYSQFLVDSSKITFSMGVKFKSVIKIPNNKSPNLYFSILAMEK
jgi:hypothetical protein